VRAVVIATRHDSHAELAAQGLERGLAVFVEKPLATDEIALKRVADAYRKHGGILLVGFNRRFAGPTQALLKALPRRRGPGLVIVRIAAGALPPGHWTQDATEGGGRIAGEVCHFVDLASTLLGQAPAGIYARSSDDQEPRLTNNISIVLDFPDQSTAMIQYHAAGGQGMPKELIEVAWDGASARIEDFRTLQLWTAGRTRRRTWRRQDKGHRQEMTAFLDWVVNGNPAWRPEDGISSTAATLALVQSLATGERVPVATSPPLGLS
jgi:predicted dehydrogenase